jgi:hypothetical protein
MIPAFQRHYKEALSQRGQLTVPNLKIPLILLDIWTLVYLSIAVMIAPENNPGRYFIKEGGMVTTLSAIFLALASIFSGISFKLSRERKGLLKFFWLLTTVGFAFLFLDELIGFHEMTGRYLDPAIGIPEGFRKWDDIVVILYGVVALFVMAGFLPEIFRYPRVMELMGMAFLFYFIHTLVDSISVPRTDLSAIIEESAKVFCAEYLAISMFVAQLGIKAAGKIKRGS